MRRPSPKRRPALAAASLAILASCGDSYTPGDDDSGGGAGGCEAEAGPLDLTLSGALQGSLDFAAPVCDPSGPSWRATWLAEDGWRLQLDVVDPVDGEMLHDGVSVRLEGDGGIPSFVSEEEDGATFDVQVYLPPDPPCGVWTVNALEDGAGGFVIVSPQPAPLRCE